MNQLLIAILVGKGRRFFFRMITVQFVPPGVTQAESSPIFTFGTYHHWPNKTLDRNVSQNHQACLHTVLFNVTRRATFRSTNCKKHIKSVELWYNKERKCDILININFPFFHPSVRLNINMPG